MPDLTSQHLPHILIVDDDDRLRSLLKKFLHDHGFMVTAAADAQEACRKLERFIFDLMILDVMMPGQSGLDLLAEQRTRLAMPVLMLSAMGESDDRIRGLEIGAEDYVTKPFEPKELVLRIKALLRRMPVGQSRRNIVAFGNYRFDISSGQLKCGEQLIYLTSNELALLKALAENAGKPVSREELGSRIPGVANERSVDVQITRLRKKIEESDGKPIYLQTVRGAGYILYAQEQRT
jgi:two-component system, OmpR family, phosphate regulon response regulator OmpR